MRKYWTVFKTMWQNSIEYRVDFFAHMILSVISLLVLVFIWSAIFKQVDNFSGYTLSTMITYLVMVRFLHFTARGNIARLMADEIKEGRISKYLLKPVNYLGWWFSCFLSERFFEAFLRILLIIFFLSLLPQYFSITSLQNIMPFLLFLPISLMINFIYSILIAYSAFFITDTRLFRTTLGLAISFFAGELIPLDIFPGFLKTVSLFLPFQYLLYFPVKILQGTLSANSVISGVIISAAWVLVFMALSLVLWKRGLKRYESVGQ